MSEGTPPHRSSFHGSGDCPAGSDLPVGDLGPRSTPPAPECISGRLAMRRLDVAVIGDRFMQPQVFVAALPGLADGIELRTRTLELPWPDVAMQHGYAGDDLEGLKEFVG